MSLAQSDHINGVSTVYRRRERKGKRERERGKVVGEKREGERGVGGERERVG